MSDAESKPARLGHPSPEVVIGAVVDYLRHTASGYALMRSIKANGARDALYQIADKFERDWQSIVLPRLPAEEVRRG